MTDPRRSCLANSPVTTADIVVPSQDEGPPQATTDPSGYFPYLWCGAGTSTYVFIDPIGNYGYNKGTNQPIFWTGLDGAHNATINAMKANAASNVNPPTGDGSIDGPNESSLNFLIPVNNLTGTSGIAYVDVFAQDSNHQKLTWGIYSSALEIMKDFVLSYPLFADAMYFQIGDSKWSTVGHGYMGIVLQGSTQCYLKGSEAQNNGLPCAMPKNYPDN